MSNKVNNLGGKLDQVDLTALSAAYEPEELLGEGTYGVVFRAHNKATGAKYAIKKLRLDGFSEGVPATTIREVTLLHDLNDNPNIVRLLDVVCSEHRVYLVFELLDEDLRAFIKRYRPVHGAKPTNGTAVPLSFVRDFTRQILYALWTCHNSRIIHRDLKPGNILVANYKDKKSGETKFYVKLADFGLARTFEMSVQTYTNEVMTLWYRSPEIILGERHYTPAADVWSVGCIVAEMILGYSLFRGENSRDQLDKIFYVVGTPTEQTWPGVTKLPGYDRTFKVYHVAPLPTRLRDYDEKAVEFIAYLLVTNPKLRPTIPEILEHPFLKDEQ
ncbi:Protein kinase [Lotmaria passim]